MIFLVGILLNNCLASKYRSGPKIWIYNFYISLKSNFLLWEVSFFHWAIGKLSIHETLYLQWNRVVSFLVEDNWKLCWVSIFIDAHSNASSAYLYILILSSWWLQCLNEAHLFRINQQKVHRTELYCSWSAGGYMFQLFKRSSSGHAFMRWLKHAADCRPPAVKKWMNRVALDRLVID